MRRSFAVLVCLATFGCGEPGPTEADAGAVDGGTADAGDEPVAEATPPDFASCPADWHAATTESGLSYCAPWPASGPIDCAGAEAHFPGGAGCEQVGDPCPAGDFPDAASFPAGARVLYVRPGATSGDGSREAPFGTIVEAKRVATIGTIIALSKGAHAGPVSISSELVLWGACAAETTLAASGIPGAAVVRIDGAAATLRNLRITDSPQLGIVVMGSRTSATLDGVVVENVAQYAVVVREGATLAGSDVVIRGVTAVTSDDGYGVYGWNAGAIELSRAAVERATVAGIWLLGGTLSCTDCAVRATQPHPGGLSAAGVVLLAATLTAERLALHGNIGHGLVVYEVGAAATVDWAAIEDTRGLAGMRTAGRAVETRLGRLELRHTVIDGYASGGVFAGATELVLEDVLVQNGRGTEGEGLFGNGVGFLDGSRARATRLAVERARYSAIDAISGSQVELVDVIIRDTLPQVADESRGYGMSGSDVGTSLDAVRVTIDRSHAYGILAQLAATLRLSDVVVRDTASAISYSPAPGVILEGALGRGMSVQSGAVVELSDGLFLRNREAAVLVHDATARLEDVTITDALPRACVETVCPDNGAGSGLLALQNANVAVSGFAITDSSQCGIQIARNAGVDLSDGEVRGHPIGVCVQVDGYDLARLMDGVIYRDNGTNLDATSLPIPEL